MSNTAVIDPKKKTEMMVATRLLSTSYQFRVRIRVAGTCPSRTANANSPSGSNHTVPTPNIVRSTRRVPLPLARARRRSVHVQPPRQSTALVRLGVTLANVRAKRLVFLVATNAARVRRRRNAMACGT